MKKSTAERADLNTLLVSRWIKEEFYLSLLFVFLSTIIIQNHAFYKRYESDSDSQDVASWIQQVCRMDSETNNESSHRRNGSTTA